MPDPTAPAPAPELLDDAAGWLSVEVRAADGTTHPATIDTYAAYTAYCDAVGQATADGRDAATRRWAAEQLGREVSTLTAVRVWNRVCDLVQRDVGKSPGRAGSTASTSAAPSPPAPAAP